MGLWKSWAVENDRFDVLVAELRRDLIDCVVLLQHVGEQHWADWLQATVTRLDGSERQAVERVLGAFGGMGSFSDLVLDPTNGHDLGTSEIEVTNERLARLRSSIYQTATDLRRDLDRG